MASTLSPSIQAEVSEDRWPAEPLRPVDRDARPSLGKRTSRTLTRFLITFCIGVAATLAWQSYGDANAPQPTSSRARSTAHGGEHCQVAGPAALALAGHRLISCRSDWRCFAPKRLGPISGFVH
jgi:hypothetical protein